MLQPWLILDMFAYTYCFNTHKEVSQQSNIQAVSACGGDIYFNKIVQIEIKFGHSYATEKFYLMDNLLRVILLRFPLLSAILEAGGGTLNITDLKKIFPC